MRTINLHNMKYIHLFLIAFLLWAKPSFAQITTEERLGDTTFNDGGWTLDPSDSSLATICTGASAYTQPNCGCINPGQNKAGTGIISQAFMFSASNTQYCTISFWYDISSTNTTDSFDVLEVKIRDEWNPQRPPIILARFNNLAHASGSYRKEVIRINWTLPEMSKYQSMIMPVLLFEGKDSSGLTAFYIDDVHLEMTSGPPIIDFSASDTTINVGDSIAYTNNSTGGMLTCTWKLYDGSSGQGYEEVNDFVPTSKRYDVAGTYAVTLTAYNQIGTKTMTKQNYITVSPKQGVGVQKNENAPTFTIFSYPNPVTDVLYLEFEDELVKRDMRVSITNQLGQEVRYEILTSGTTQVGYEMSELASGVYSIIVSSGDVILTQKMIKR